MSPRLRGLIAVVVAGGVLTTAAVIATTASQGVGRVPVLVLLTIVTEITWIRPLPLLRGEETESYTYDELTLVVAFLLLEPVGVLIAVGASAIFDILLQRTPIHRRAFTMGTVLLSLCTAIALVEVAGGTPSTYDGSIRPILLALVGTATFTSMNTLLIAAAIGTSQGVPVRSVVSDGLGFRVLIWMATTSVGLLVAVAGTAYAWAPMLALIPLVMVHVVMSAYLKARRDRQRLDGLLDAALRAHASVRPEDVTSALTSSALELLQTRHSRIDSEPPEDDELGVRLDVSGESARWLVVSDKKGLESFDQDDGHVLTALAAVGASAVENALLVDQLRHQTTHDTLTGLPNQLLFDDRCEQAIGRAGSQRERLAVMVLDLDAFRKVNESLGHSAGNELLCQVARRLGGSVRDVDTVARMTGDEFTVLLPGLGSGATVELVAEKLLTALRRPFQVDDQEVYMTASVGIAVYPDDGIQAGELVRNAETAMHRAKGGGGNTTRLYDSAMNELAHVYLSRQTELHNALRRDELVVQYQPQMDLRSFRMVGVEALVRWQHPTLGLLGPFEFVPLAEESDLILDLDMYVLRVSCRQARAWDASGLPPLRMGVNLSGRHFNDDRVVRRVAQVLDETGLPAERLELEITESVAVHEADGTLTYLRQLRDMGVSFAIDDFGTGYSALAQMQRFPVDRLKIDRSFVNHITSATGAAPLVTAFIGIARALHLDVIAEGVETIEQQQFLKNNGCREAQGFLYSRPVPATEIERLASSKTLGLRPNHLIDELPG